MTDRIKQLRKALGLTQTEFGAKIGVKGNTITNYETGLRSPSDAVVHSICREFNASEEWLRNGNGNMFRETSRSDELARFFGDLLADEPDFRHRFIAVLARMSTDEWRMLEHKIDEINAELKKADP